MRLRDELVRPSQALTAPVETLAESKTNRRRQRLIQTVGGRTERK